MARILLVFSSCFLLLHHLIPHVHHGQMSQMAHVEAHQEATNLLDQLKLVFHNDLGAEHLEWMSQFSGSEEDATLILLPVFADEWKLLLPALPLRLPFKKLLPRSRQAIIFTSHLFQPYALRAPPSNA